MVVHFDSWNFRNKMAKKFTFVKIKIPLFWTKLKIEILQKGWEMNKFLRIFPPIWRCCGVNVCSCAISSAQLGLHLRIGANYFWICEKNYCIWVRCCEKPEKLTFFPPSESPEQFSAAFTLRFPFQVRNFLPTIRLARLKIGTYCEVFNNVGANLLWRNFHLKAILYASNFFSYMELLFKNWIYWI